MPKYQQHKLSHLRPVLWNKLHLTTLDSLGSLSLKLHQTDGGRNTSLAETRVLNLPDPVICLSLLLWKVQDPRCCFRKMDSISVYQIIFDRLTKRIFLT